MPQRPDNQMEAARRIRRSRKQEEGLWKLTDLIHDEDVKKDIWVLFDRKLIVIQTARWKHSEVGESDDWNDKDGRTFHYMGEEVFRLLYTSLMRLHMDYVDCIWSPHLKVDIAQQENAQRRVTRLVPDLRDRCYYRGLSACMRALNLPSLLYRRRRMDMIQTFHIMKGIDDLEASDFFTMNSLQEKTRGHGMKNHEGNISSYSYNTNSLF